MNEMKRLLGAAACVFAAAAWAQAPARDDSEGVARLASVTGSVLVTGEAGLAAGAVGQRLFKGSRIIATANSEALVRYDNGCEVRVRENERFEVDTEKPCNALAAQMFGVDPVAAVGPGLLALIPGVGAGAVVINDIRDQPPVSPN